RRGRRWCRAGAASGQQRIRTRGPQLVDRGRHAARSGISSVGGGAHRPGAPWPRDCVRRHRGVRTVVRANGGGARTQRVGEAVAHGQLVQTVGMSVLVFVVPWLLPWPRGRRRDPMTRWLGLGVVAAWTGGAAALADRIGDLPGAHVAGPLLLLATVPLIAVGA